MTSSIGVVTNPRSGRNQRDPGSAQALAYVLGEEGEIVSPRDVDAISLHVRRFRDRGITTLCIDGGDGTLHRVLTAVVRVYGDGPLPAVAVLRGGTMNIVARSVGSLLPRAEALRAIVEAHASGQRLPTTVRRLLRVRLGEDVRESCGFLFGTGVVARFLEEYAARPAPAPFDAAILLGRAAISAVLGGSLAERLTRPFEGTVALDGRTLDGTRWTAVAIGTIEQMGLGFRVFHRVGVERDHLQLVTIGGSARELALELPSLYRGLGVHRPGNASATGSEVELRSAAPIDLTIDGDIYVADGGHVRVTVGPEITFVLPRPVTAA